ncbi:MAG: SRPBCC family protein [Nocardia sp.]|nr:SRPBCC family protein [Nocardia sp.]
MKLDNTFSIPVPIDEAFPVLLDLERLAPCVPGATITDKDGDDYHGKIKVKLGPVGLSYKGIIKVVSHDQQAGIAVLEGRGREQRGNGTANATITCRLVEKDGVTDVFVDTDLAITGKPAQFGRGALADVAGTLIGQFADNLADELTAGAESTAAAATSVNGASVQESTASAETSDQAAQPLAASTTATEERPAPTRAPAEPLDLLAAAGGGRVKQYGQIAAVVVGVVLLIALLRKLTSGEN